MSTPFVPALIPTSTLQVFVTIASTHLALYCFVVRRSCIIRGLLQGKDLATMQESFHRVEPEARTFVLLNSLFGCMWYALMLSISRSIPLPGSRGKVGAHESR